MLEIQSRPDSVLDVCFAFLLFVPADSWGRGIRHLNGLRFSFRLGTKIEKKLEQALYFTIWLSYIWRLDYHLSVTCFWTHTRSRRWTFQTDDLNGSSGKADETLRQAALGIFVLTFIFGSSGNLFVLAKKHGRSINDIFMVHLVISDLSFIFLHLPVFVYMQVSTFQESFVYCKIIWPMMTVSFWAGIFTVNWFFVLSTAYFKGNS